MPQSQYLFDSSIDRRIREGHWFEAEGSMFYSLTSTVSELHPRKAILVRVEIKSYEFNVRPWRDVSAFSSKPGYQ